MTVIVESDVSPDRAFGLLQEHGYLIIRNLIDRDTIEGMRREYRPHLDASVTCKSEDQGTSTKRFKGAFIKSRAFVKLGMNPLILAIADRVLLPNCKHYTLCGSTCFEVGPGAGYQPLHRDDVIWPMARPRPDLIIQVMCAISDFTEANGATRIVPGSHLWPETRQARQDEAISAVMPSGSVAVIGSSTLHGAGMNTTSDNYRMSVSSTYGLGWLRQQDNQYLFATPEVARKLPKDFAKLIGYQSLPYLGQVHIEKDLAEVLEPGGLQEIFENAWS